MQDQVQPAALTMEDALLVLRVLGPRPQEALAALVDYGLSDTEIGRYVDLPPGKIATLRVHWRMTENL